MAPRDAPGYLRSEDMQSPDTSLIARAEALNAFNRMQTAASNARKGAVPTSPTSTTSKAYEESPSKFCCFGGGGGGRGSPTPVRSPAARPIREYHPENLSVQPVRHPWSQSMEWLILACIDFLEEFAIDERNLFAVSAVDDYVRGLSVSLGAPLPRNTDPHVASGAIKMQMRYADAPLVPKDCLGVYIAEQGAQANGEARRKPQTFAETNLAKGIEHIKMKVSTRRAYIFARFMRLLGRVSANVANSGMNAHCLAKCVAPPMLHWDPNTGYALLMLGKITGYVMCLIDEARAFDENLCQTIVKLS